MKNLVFSILPAGIKDMSDVYNSKEFKDFIEQESKKEANKPKELIGFPVRIIIDGISRKCRSFLSEYLQTLPQISYDELMSGKADGRLVVCENIDKIKFED